MRLVLVFILPIACVLAITQLLERFESPIDRAGLEAGAMVWGDRVFTSKAELAAWLESRGIDYEDWVARHPGAAPWEAATQAQAQRPVDDSATQQQQPPRPVERSAAPAPQPKPRAEPQRQAPETTAREPEPPPSEAATPVASVESESDTSGGIQSLLGPLLLGLIGVLGLLLITASAIPPMWYVEHAHAGLVVVDRRAEFAVAGLAMLVGLGIPFLL